LDAAAVDELVRTYQTHPVAMVAAIYARPDRNLRNFADAFRLRKDPASEPSAAGPESATGPPPTPAPPTRPDAEGGQRGLTHG
jgi:hypothetical protein